MKSKERNIGIGKKGARGKAQVQVIFDTDTFWLSQQRMAELFGVTQQDISYHLQQINDSGEIHLSDGYKKYLYGSEKWSDEAMYNLDVITLCGSTRFKEQFLEAQKRLTLEGNIVISFGGYIGSSTRSEIEYAKKNGRKVNYLEPVE